ncbi:MAG TPA: prolyl oligopeptidase family serine peptidase [Gemmatimonadales bacterium]|nr:prolyl oligopeptidase family serine peptidase [Gemmatimonadales bacterium]
MSGHRKAALSTFSCLFLSLFAAAALPAEEAGAKPYEQPPEIREFRKTAIEVKFPSGGLMLHGWIYKPPGEGPFPAVIWNHGSEQEPTAHPELGKFYTDHGYVLFLPVRHGHTPSPGEYIQDAVDRYRTQAADKTSFQRMVVELQDVYNQDVVAAIDWIRKQPFVDGKHLVVSGCSYGGIQTLLTAEQGLGVSAFVSFAPGAMSWQNLELRNRLLMAVRSAKAPVFLIQAQNDYDTGPSEVLGPVIRAQNFLNRAKISPAFGTTNPEGHFGFACWTEGIAIWGPEVLEFLAQTGVPPSAPAAAPPVVKTSPDPQGAM